MANLTMHISSTSKKHTTGFLEKNFGDFCKSRLLTAPCYWPSSHCIPALRNLSPHLRS